MNKLSPFIIALGFVLVIGSSTWAANKPQYNQDIRPILAEHCFACHGPDSAARKAGLRLDNREDALKSEAFVPHKPEESELIKRIESNDDADVMPPPKTNKKLTAKQKQILKDWVANGGEYQLHWSFITPKRPALPDVKNKQWVRNPMDQFILAELEKKGLTPAPEADRRILARRLSLDLTGLPPSESDVEQFVKDTSPEAYEKYVDQLLKSVHWGEHRGRYWLDAARYADTHGIHFDNFREMWSYRNWVINAFNQNMPFDQFTMEQLAGDLLPNHTVDQVVATGFNRCNITTNEGGAIDEEYLVLYTRDRTETTSQVWLGLTAGCAVCHDHKLDPISQKEFYSMAAFFNNTTQRAMDGNIRDTPPITFVPKLEDRPRWDTLKNLLADSQKKLNERKQSARGDFDKWLTSSATASVKSMIPKESLVLHFPFHEGAGKTLHYALQGEVNNIDLDSGFDWIAGRGEGKAFGVKAGKTIELPEVGNFEKDQAFSVGGWVRLNGRGKNGALLGRMDQSANYRGWDLWIDNDRPGMHIIHSWDQDAIKVISKNTLAPNKWFHVWVTYDGSGKASGIKVYVDGLLQPLEIHRDTLKSSIRTTVPFTIGQRHKDSRLVGVGLQDLRLYTRALQPPEAMQLARTSRTVELLKKPADKRSAAEKTELFDWWLLAFDAPYKGLLDGQAKLQLEENEIRSRGTIAHVMNERTEAAMAYILNRGEYDKRKDPVKPETPKIMPKMSDDLPKNRLGFAKWLLQSDHPLTARVTVNRFWQEVFGTGLVKTAGDFGIAGDLPTHPELLDWLAVEFQESGWDIKKFFKLLVTSATYRQSALTTPEKRERDPANRLLSRGPRFRMDAEMIRDYALAASGLLVRKIGGPSVKPYQPEGVWEAVAMIGSNTRDYKRDSGENLYRRSMYTFWKRSAPPASLEIINAPNRETCTVRRERTNTPLQALVTLNDVQFVEAARFLAERVLKEQTTQEARIDFLAKRILSRPFQNAELQIVQESLKELLQHYQSHPEEAKKLIAVGESKADPKIDASQLAAWTMLTNQLLNLDEVLNK